MATHFMRILSRMMVPGPARTRTFPAGGRRVGGGRRAGSRATPTPLGSPIPPAHTQDCYPALQGEHNFQNNWECPWGSLCPSGHPR